MAVPTFRCPAICQILNAGVLLGLATLASCKGFSAVPNDAAPFAVDKGDRDAVVSDAPPTADAAVPKCEPGQIFSADVDDHHEPGRHTALVVEPSGVIHIAHYAAGPTPNMFGVGGYHDARYSRYQNGSWISEDIYEPGVIGGEMAMGVDASGTVHVVFYDYQEKDLLYCQGTLGKWQSPKRIASAGLVGWANDLVVDSQGDLHLVTVSGDQEALLYLRREQGIWQTPSVLAKVAYGYQAGLAQDAGGKLHASIISDGSLKHVHGDPTAFNQVEALESGLKEATSDIATSFPNDVHIAYRDASDALAYRERVGDVWSEKRVLDATSVLSQDIAIVASETGDIWVVYHDEDQGTLRLSRRKGGIWSPSEAIDTAGHVGGFPSAALGPQGALHIAHYNQDNRALRYTRVCSQ